MPSHDALRIDGSYGEGGGQTLRTALALSMVTGRPFELVNIRKGRPTPGLAPQHLACVRAAAAICSATAEGASLGSARLRFEPSGVAAGHFEFDVAEERGSAGSVLLILQALLPALCLAPGPSQLILRGGTHVPWSPPFDYAQRVLLPALAGSGMRASLKLLEAGWYPAGGGRVRADIDPRPPLRPVDLTERGARRRLSGVSSVSNLPLQIAQRQRRSALERLAGAGLEAQIECLAAASRGTGTAITLVAECERGLAGFSALGRRGKPAEQVGREAADALLAYWATRAALDEHLADQLVVFLALAAGRRRGEDDAADSRFSTSRITRHLLTNLWLVQQWLPVIARVDGREGEPGLVTIAPRDRSA